LWLIAIAAIGPTATAADSPVISIESWSNVTAGEDVTLHFRLPNAAAGEVVAWSVAVGTAVIVRSQSEVRTNANRQPGLSVKFRLPQGEAKAIIPVSVRVTRSGHEVLAKLLWIYPSDPFQRPIPHLPAEPLVLFDPQGTTAARWEGTSLRFRLEKNISALDTLQQGTLVLGEGVSFREFRGLPEVIRRAAMRGLKVLCLAPAAGTLVLSGETTREEGTSVTPGQLINLNLARGDILKRFDKHLDGFDWRGADPAGTGTLQLISRSNQISAEVVADPGGWPWLEADYAGGGRIVVCGFRCIEQWESGPAPRHALWHILAHTVQSADTRGTESQADEPHVQGP